MSDAFSVPVYALADDQIPADHRRTVIEFVARDEHKRRMFEHHVKNIGLPYTEAICNGKFHGVRSLTSYWPSQVQIGLCDEILQALSMPHLEGNPSPDTPKDSEVPALVLEHMREGHIHYSIDELLTHTTLSVCYFGGFDHKVEIMLSLEKLNNCARTTLNEDGSCVITATLAGWKKYLDDMNHLYYMTGNGHHCVFDYINKLFYTVYPKPSKPVKWNRPEDDEPDPKWGR